MALWMMMNLLFRTNSLQRKTSTFRTIRDLEELDESESFAEFRFGKRDIRILKEVLQIPDMITCSQRSVCDGLEGLCMLLKRLSFPCRYGDMIHRFAKLVLARRPWFRILLKEKSF